MFLAVVDLGMQNVTEDPHSYFIFIHQLSLSVDFPYFLLNNELGLNVKIQHVRKL